VQPPALSAFRRIPPIVADTEPSLQLAAKVRLDAPQAAFIWQTVGRVATVNCRKPYAGWCRRHSVSRSATCTDRALTSAGVTVVRGIDSLGWTPAETLETYLRLQPFAEDWGAPGMEAYDALWHGQPGDDSRARD
jgi:hypothetical protein